MRFSSPDYGYQFGFHQPTAQQNWGSGMPNYLHSRRQGAHSPNLERSFQTCQFSASNGWVGTYQGWHYQTMLCEFLGDTLVRDAILNQYPAFIWKILQQSTHSNESGPSFGAFHCNGVNQRQWNGTWNVDGKRGVVFVSLPGFLMKWNTCCFNKCFPKS